VIISKGMALGVPWPDVAPVEAPTLAAEPSYSCPMRSCSPFLRESINALLRTLAARDPYTGQHSARVTDIASRFAGSLGLAARDLHTLRNAVYLHDIGKIGISDVILLKPGPLTAEERQIINTHPLIGEKIVEPLGLTPQEKEIIRLHHERWDGEGYPQGLSGEDIPFLCRLTSLADVYDALTTDRPYRRKFTLDEAVQEIKTQAGRQFDPTLTREFVGFIAAAPPMSLC
jgi:putative nucleotidyltransferase with HDIG domain